ncbi:STAS domain-containing protein [Actinophytocola sp.]|uniref:STAS domain-containing protein n=1 Tax=Actinophytocola sp. TaxID=1872138 RepID=UPI002D80421E|nr:STAS domain-containing protein [Actinophytocola sp.]HET9139174.1 STAS domain-containing protein [Actinophytocola sp.]
MQPSQLDQHASPAVLRGPPPLAVAVSHQHPLAVVVEVAGELDAFTAPQLLDTLQDVLREQAPVLVVDLSAVQFMSSAGISVLLETHQRAGPHTALRIVASSPPTLRPLQVTGLDTTLDLYPSRPAALAPQRSRQTT